MQNIVKISILSALLSTLFAFTACGQQRQPQYTPEELALRKDIGEMLLVGFRGTTVAESAHIARDITEYNIGGVILFEYDAPSGRRPRNITSPNQVKALCAQLQRLSSETLLIGIDQEGGRVNRLKEKYGFPPFASAQQSALAGNDSVRYYAQLTAQTLHSLGINLNFAPCVDVNINPDCPVIGKIERSFSSSPKLVTECAKIWIDEQQKAGVLSCAKHFPGHGSSDKDSHMGLVDVSTSWQRSELIPYRQLIEDSKLDMIMTTHVFNAQIDSVWPATLSQKTLQEYLRDQLGFKGIIITDDLAMGAMVKQYSFDTIIRQTILAGADMLCLSNNGKSYDEDLVPRTVNLIFEMVKQGLIPENRIHESAERIRHLKAKIH